MEHKMRSDLDALMQANDIDVLLVTGPAFHNPAMVYLTGGGHISTAALVKKRGEPGVLFHISMERDEAAKAAAQNGLVTRSYEGHPYKERIQEAKGNPLVAETLRYCHMLQDLGISSGRVALYGQVDLSSSFAVFYELQKQMPDLTLVGDVENLILGSAMATKDEVEVEHIRQMGRITTEVVAQAADYLTSRPVEGEVLLGPDDKPLTLGQVKGLINAWLAERGAENPEGTIFAIGRDAAVPHSSGNPQDLMRLGQTIVFDIFPCEAGGGYFYDFTRTWCLGYAPDAVQALYADVLSTYQTLQRELKPGALFRDYQTRACELFAALGHPTPISHPGTEEGYVHGIGHGVGLNIHERPGSYLNPPSQDTLAPGSVFTVEPGLYYPDRGMGVRLEDTYWARPNDPEHPFEVLADYPLDLVLPMKRK